MHLAFLIRGHKHWQDRFISQLSDRYLPFSMYNPDLKAMERKIIEMRLCPIQLFDLCFPDEHYDAVAHTIFQTSDLKPMEKKLKPILWAARKAMGFKKMPKFSHDRSLPMSPAEHCEIIPIGIKEDYWITEDGKHVKKKDKTPLSTEGI